MFLTSIDSALIWENIRENLHSGIIYPVLILLASYLEEIFEMEIVINGKDIFIKFLLA